MKNTKPEMGYKSRDNAPLRDYLRFESVTFVFCLQIHARAECTMNEKFSILHEVELNRLSYKSLQTKN